ncbi:MULTISPECIES: KAP family P-loop NTPase fold protein [Roseovarius]|uniref:KAP family P-loop NTPase fold protein n=1 Tax=Roseovarius TaxID=74030 RepID=UPI00273FE1A9|nr:MULTISPECIES: P-loop NTPase fold protein [unclassified Roseovarius]
MSHTRLTPKALEIDLYKQGFEGVCKLGRASDGKKLSDLVERISEPMVIALDAPWGAGKSVFLKCWVGAHKLENNGTAETVYFDAFKHDFMDDPLIGLTGAISERLEANPKTKFNWQKAKQAASKLVRPLFRIALSVATVGATEAASSAVDPALSAGSKELEDASKTFWEKEEGKRAAMENFRTTLEQVAAEQKLVIVVDELDRCRPDYALSLLEVVKHFFDVDNVHFVLGVNLRELANSVRARYGEKVQAERYLQKFVTLSMPLIPQPSRAGTSQTQIRYFRKVAQDIGLCDTWKEDWIAQYLSQVIHHNHLSLRDVEKIATLAMVTPEPSHRMHAALHLYVGALIMQVIAPSLIIKARNKQLSDDDFFTIFHFRDRRKGTPDGEPHEVWTLATWDRQKTRPVYLDDASTSLFDDKDPRETLSQIIAETLDVFRLMA